MIITEFLTFEEFNKYGDWLTSQDNDTLNLYFGVGGNHQYVVNSLMDRVCSFPEVHHILVAKESNRWTGTIHIAAHGSTVEFGIIVHQDYRGQGIAGDMLEEAILWAQNRGYTELFMHCLGWNKPIKHLCQKHGLLPKNIYGDSEVQISLPHANWITLNQEVAIKQRNIYHTFLQKSQLLFQEIYG